MDFSRIAIRRQLARMRRRAYEWRAWIPGLKRQHTLEAMVGPLGYWNELREYQLRLLRENGLLPHHRFLDLGCGPLQGGIAIMKYLAPNNYIGVDVSPENLDAGYGEISEHKLAHQNPRLIRSDLFGEGELANLGFDFVWASQILYYFDDALLRTLFQQLAQRLTPQGKFLGDIIGGSHPEFARPEKSDFLPLIKLHQAERLGELAAPFGLTVKPLKTLEYYGYPRRLSLRTNLLIEVTRSI